MEAHLAEINIGRLRAPVDDPIVSEFVDALDQVNALAESHPGFVWRHRTDAGTGLAEHPYADPLIIINLSVWTSPEALRDFAYRSAHAKFYARRAAWFEMLADHHLALWWVPVRARPSIAEATARLEHRRRVGDTAYAFGFKRIFPVAESLVSRPVPTDETRPVG